MVPFLYQANARPYDVIKNSTQPQGSQTNITTNLQRVHEFIPMNMNQPKEAHKDTFVSRMRRGLLDNPCYIKGSYKIEANGRYSVKCYKSSPRGCLSSILKYGYGKCRSIETLISATETLTTDCACVP